MPTFPLTGGGLSGGDLPVNSDADVLAVFPKDMRPVLEAPVRDALIAAMRVMFETYQEKAEYAAAQSDSLRATEIYLDGLGQDHDVFRLGGGVEEDYRTAIFATQAVVTPEAILAAVNALTLPATDVVCQYLESALDGAFITDGTAEYDSSFVGTAPRYPDRLYPDDATENAGYVRSQSDPGNMWVFGDDLGRYFVLRLPNLAAADDLFMWAMDAVDEGAWIADGSDTSGAESDGSVISFNFEGGLTADEIYLAIVGVVDRIKGHGIRFQAIVDEDLTATS